MCYHWNDFNDFLDTHDYVTNKLACLVRDVINLEYIRVIIAVVAAIGTHLINPYHTKTINTDSTHSSLKEFFSELYSDLQTKKIDNQFFEFLSPVFGSISSRLFSAVKKKYCEDVVSAVKQTATIYIEDCTTLTNTLLPDLAETLSRQRGKYYGFGSQPSEYTVFSQVVGNVDDTPVNNLQEERQCGDIDHRLKKKANLEAASRGAIFKSTSKL